MEAACREPRPWQMARHAPTYVTIALFQHCSHHYSVKLYGAHHYSLHQLLCTVQVQEGRRLFTFHRSERLPVVAQEVLLFGAHDRKSRFMWSNTYASPKLRSVMYYNFSCGIVSSVSHTIVTRCHHVRKKRRIVYRFFFPAERKGRSRFSPAWLGQWLGPKC